MLKDYPLKILEEDSSLLMKRTTPPEKLQDSSLK